MQKLEAFSPLSSLKEAGGNGMWEAGLKEVNKEYIQDPTPLIPSKVKQNYRTINKIHQNPSKKWAEKKHDWAFEQKTIQGN